MNTVSETSERVSLYYREGSSDKVYQAAIEPAGNQFLVNFAYGRRGTTLTTGTKTALPVDHTTAEKVYELILQLNKDLGTAFLIVTHDLSLASRMDRQLILKNSKFNSGD